MGNWDNLVSGMLNRQPSGVDRAFNRGLDRANLEQQQMQQRLQNDLQRGQSVNLGRLIGQNAYQKDLPQKDIIGAMAQQDPQSALKMSGLLGAPIGGKKSVFELQLEAMKGSADLLGQINTKASEISTLAKDPSNDLSDSLNELSALKNEYFTQTKRNPETSELKALETAMKLRREKRADTSQGIQQQKLNIQREELGRKEEQEQFKNFSDYKQSIELVNDLKSDIKNNKQDLGNIGFGVANIINKISGAGVSDSERVNLLLNVVSDDYAKEFRAKGTGYGNAFVKKLINNDQELINEIMKNVDQNKIIRQLNRSIPKGAYDWYEQTQVEASAPKEDIPQGRKVVSEDDFFGGM